MNRGRLLRQLRYPLLLAAFSAVITFAFGYCAFLLAEQPPGAPVFTQMWNRWDTVHYLTLAHYGYSGPGAGERSLLIVFYPLYPLTINLVHIIVRSWPIAAILISNVCCAIAFAYFLLLCRLERNAAFARRALLLLAVFPTAYFLHAAYSESMFLAAAIGAFYFARRGEWRMCGLLGMIATGTRVFGLALAPALAFEYVHQRDFRWRAIRRDAGWLALIPLGFAAYLAVNYCFFRNPFAFLAIEREHWFAYLRWPAPALHAHLHGVLHANALDRVIQNGAQIFAILLATSTLVVAAFHLRTCYTIYFAISWVLIFCNNFPLSSPRYLLCTFPMFMVLADGCRRLWVRDAVVFASTLFYAVFAALFVRGWFVF